MRTIQVVARQSIIDIAVQYYGSAASVIDLCIDNDLELDSELEPGQWLQLQDAYPESADNDTADYIQGSNIVVTGVPVISGDGSDVLLIDNEDNFIITNDGYFITVG